MVSTELLRRFPFFGFLNHFQLREVALIAEVVSAEYGTLLFEIDAPADALYLLMEGAVELHYIVTDVHEPDLRKDFLVGVVNPGEILGVSSLIEPFTYTATAYVADDSDLLRLDAAELRRLCEEDHKLALGFDRAVMKATLERLGATRTLLAAATQPI